jgi:hypothetical protein
VIGDAITVRVEGGIRRRRRLGGGIDIAAATTARLAAACGERENTAETDDSNRT